MFAELDERYREAFYYDRFETYNESQPYAIITVTRDEETKTLFHLKSTGHIEDSERTVEQTVKLHLEGKKIETGASDYELPPFAVYTMGDMIIGNGSIVGDIGTHSSKGIYFPGNTNVTVKGDIFVSEANKDLIKGLGLREGPEVKDIQNYVYPTMPKFPTIPQNFTRLADESYANYTFIRDGKLLINSWQMNRAVWELKEDAYFKEILLTNNNTFTIDIGDTDRSIVVDKINLNGHLKIKGQGRLTIYVTDEIVSAQGSIGEVDKINQLDLFYAGPKQLTVSNNIEIYGSIFAKEADLYVGGGGKIHGNIFTNASKLSMDGGSHIKAQLIFAPNANFIIDGGGVLEGRVIAKTFNSEGGASIILQEPFVLDGPISPQAIAAESNSGGNGEQSDDDGTSYLINHVSLEESSIREID